jgi:hypothetical protein
MKTEPDHLMRTRRDPDLWDRMVNSKFAGVQPILSEQESILAARKLYRHAMGKSFTGKVEITSGNRYTWVNRGVLRVNPDKREVHVRGLRALIHDLSHYCHTRLHPRDKPHSIRQVRLEAKLVKFALDRGWHEGGLRVAEKSEKPKPDLVDQRYRRMISRREKWRKESERAARLLEKAEREVRAYERRHRGRLSI